MIQTNSQWTEESFNSSSASQTQEIATTFAAHLPPKAILLFKGDLGAGKTTFIQGIARARGLNPLEITSPTFTLHHNYPGLHHFDLYRLQGKKDFITLGFEELLEEEALFCIEWPERLEDLPLKGLVYKLTFTNLDENERTILIQKESL